MRYDEAQVRRAVRDGTDPAIRPTAQQIEEIAVLTHDSDALIIIDRMLRRRLDPKAYVIRETEHTLLMIRSCLCAASDKFLAYVKAEIQPLVAEFNAKPVSEEMRGVHRVASSLLAILRDTEALAKEIRTYRSGSHKADQAKQRSHHDDKGKEIKLSPEITTTTLPITPPDTPHMRQSRERKASEVEPATPAISSVISLTTRYGGLPTPVNSPPEKQAPLAPATDKELDHVEEKVRLATSNTPPSVTTKQMEEVVEMTYHSEELRMVMDVLDMRLSALKSQQTYYHLVKTLTLIHHCLFYASDEFVEFCRRRRDIFEKLRTFRCSNSDVRSRAEAVLDRLKDQKRLEKERQSRKAMSNRRRASSPADRPKASKGPPMSPSSVSLSRPRSLEDENALVEKIGDSPEGFGGYSDVWKGKLSMDHGATFTLVAVKVLRLGSTPGNDPDRLRKRLEREVLVWQLLDHESIADYHGVVYQSNKSPAIVSSWYTNGCADVYLREHPEVNPLKTLCEIVLGVEYLHDKGIVHGDLKGKNVMIDESGHAKLIDFGLSRLLGPVSGPSGFTTSNIAFSIRWCAPELVSSEDSQTTTASDVYAFASTALQLLTGEPPYATLKDVTVIMTVVRGVTPRNCSNEFRYTLARPDKIWHLLDSCWREARLRPSISEVKEKLQPLYH